MTERAIQLKLLAKLEEGNDNFLLDNDGTLYVYIYVGEIYAHCVIYASDLRPVAEIDGKIIELEK